MFCFQCQETAKNTGCTVRGVCGKPEITADLQDLLVHVCKGISFYAEKLKGKEGIDRKVGRFLTRALFTTLTNVGWDDDVIIERIKEGLRIKDELRERASIPEGERVPDCATWSSFDRDEIIGKATKDELRITSIEDEDTRSLIGFLVTGVKGIAAYTEHASILGYEKDEIYDFIIEALSSTIKGLTKDQRIGLILKAGEIAVEALRLLDEANTSTYGHPEITEINLNVRENPGILISGHDLKDLEELLEQTKGTGIDIYTHGEMLPAHSYPKFKEFKHLVGNYGGSWWHQNEEFESFNGPIILTTNCLIPLRKENTYLNRLFTTGPVSYPGAKHIPDRSSGGKKDFSQVIEFAKKCAPPKPLDNQKIYGGFGHNQVLALSNKIIDAVKKGAIRRFIVMAGCDGRHKTREYYTEVAQKLPKDTVILTAGCAKYRYNKLPLGDIDGIPRVIDAGQCNDSYSLAVIAMKLKDAFGLDDINKLPVSYDIAWYEQKAVSVLLALLSLGVKGIRLGPTLPGFLSPNVAKVLVEKFDIKSIKDPESDIEAMMKGL